VHVTAFALGRCGKLRVYTKLEWYFPEYGEHFEEKAGFSACGAQPGFSAQYAEPTKCPPLALKSGYVGTEVSAGGMTCEAAERIVRQLPGGSYAHERRLMIGGYRCGTEGAALGTPTVSCELDHRSVGVTLTR
jgi:hypothetical protein